MICKNFFGCTIHTWFVFLQVGHTWTFFSLLGRLQDIFFQIFQPTPVYWSRVYWSRVTEHGCKNIITNKWLPEVSKIRKGLPPLTRSESKAYRWAFKWKFIVSNRICNRPCHGFRRHLDHLATREKLKCLKNLMSNNSRRTAVLKKRNCKLKLHS